MSEISLFCFNKNRENVEQFDFQNAWRGGIYLWQDITKRYLFKELNMFSVDWKELWDLIKNHKMSTAEGNVHASTMDKFVIARKNLLKFSEYYKEYGRNNPDSVFTEIGEQFEDIFNNHKNIEYIALGWNSISVDIEDFCKEIDEEENSSYVLLEKLANESNIDKLYTKGEN